MLLEGVKTFEGLVATSMAFIRNSIFSARTTFEQFQLRAGQSHIVRHGFLMVQELFVSAEEGITTATDTMAVRRRVLV